nr:hypothetical protein [Tanacetum cinerariifolium]
FQQGEDPIECINKAMAFLSAAASRAYGATVYSAKEAKEYSMVYGEIDTEDLDAYDSNFDDLSSAKAILMANLSSCDSDVLLRNGFPSADGLQEWPKPVLVCLAMFGPCQCDPGLSPGPLICLVGPRAHYGNTTQACYPTGITSTYFKSHMSVGSVYYTCRHLVDLCIYYAKEPFLCWVGVSRHYTLDENCYPTFWDGEECGDGSIWFIRHSDPIKVRVREGDPADREVKLLKMSEGRTVALDPPATVAPEDNSDSIHRLNRA